MQTNATTDRRPFWRLVVAGVAALAFAAITIGASQAQLAGFTITPNALDFGHVAVGATSAEQKISLINDTGMEYRVALASTGSISSFPFTAAGCQRDGTGAFIVPAQLACLVFFRFAPQQAGTASMQTTWTSVGTGETWHRTISGVGTPAAAGLVAHPAVLQLRPSLALTLTLSATLTQPGGSPVAGQTITFEAGGKQICNATTNATGKATCGGPAGALQAVLGLGYTARFAGNTNLGPASAQGGLAG